jgi:ribosomal protein S18 acetylase RimI-like enzyme
VYLDPRQEGPKAFGARWELSPNPADSYRRLSADITEMTLKPHLPAGFTLRPYSEISNLATLVEAMNRSYAGLYGHRTTSEAAFAPLLEAFDLDGFFILFDHKNHVAGTVSAEVAPDLSEENGVPTGRLGSPGVVPEHRSKELYQALLASGMAYLKAHGMVIADLETWGEPESTINIYKTHGFTLRSEALAYTKEL